MAESREYWRTVADRLDSYSIGECQLQYAWNRYCRDIEEYGQQILLNDSDWFSSTFVGMDLTEIYHRLADGGYDVNDRFAREDDYGYPVSSDDRASLISHEEYALLASWARSKADESNAEDSSDE